MSLATLEHIIKLIIEFFCLLLPLTFASILHWQLFGTQTTTCTSTTRKNRMAGILRLPRTLLAVISPIDNRSISSNGCGPSDIYRQHHRSYGCHLQTRSDSYEKSYLWKGNLSRCSIGTFLTLCTIVYARMTFPFFISFAHDMDEFFCTQFSRTPSLDILTWFHLADNASPFHFPYWSFALTTWLWY